MTQNKRLSTVSVLISALLLISLGSCATAPSSTKSEMVSPNRSASTESSPSAAASATPGAIQIPVSPASTAQSPAASSAAAPEAGKTTTVTIYKADEQCVNFQPQQVEVPAGEPISGAIRKVLENQSSDDFDLTGYRVNVNRDTGVATVDLRMKPGSTRQIVSLSACEQFALFGSLRETLTKNPNWNIKSVEFTEKGKEIQL